MFFLVMPVELYLVTVFIQYLFVFLKINKINKSINIINKVYNFQTLLDIAAQSKMMLSYLYVFIAFRDF